MPDEGLAGSGGARGGQPRRLWGSIAGPARLAPSAWPSAGYSKSTSYWRRPHGTNQARHVWAISHQRPQARKARQKVRKVRKIAPVLTKTFAFTSTTRDAPLRRLHVGRRRRKAPRRAGPTVYLVGGCPLGALPCELVMRASTAAERWETLLERGGQSSRRASCVCGQAGGEVARGMPRRRGPPRRPAGRERSCSASDARRSTADGAAAPGQQRPQCQRSSQRAARRSSQRRPGTRVSERGRRTCWQLPGGQGGP